MGIQSETSIAQHRSDAMCEVRYETGKMASPPSASFQPHKIQSLFISFNSVVLVCRHEEFSVELSLQVRTVGPSFQILTLLVVPGTFIVNSGSDSE